MRTMKKRLAATLILAAGLSMAGAASAAAWSWTGTLADWAATGGVVDGDSDMKFTLDMSRTTIPDVPGTDYITISEVEIGGKDFYDVGVDWGPNGYAGGGTLAYTLTVLPGSIEYIVGSTLDSAITGDGTKSLMALTDLNGGPAIPNLTSTDGGRDPVTGELHFKGTKSLDVVQTFELSRTGLLQDSHAGFVAVPEPGQLSLAGLGLFALFLTRRRAA